MTGSGISGFPNRLAELLVKLLELQKWINYYELIYLERGRDAQREWRSKNPA